MIKINLIPREAIIEEESPGITFLVIGLAVIVVLVLIVTYTSKVTRQVSLDKQISTVDRELAQLQSVIAQVSLIKAQRDETALRKTALEGLIKTRLIYPILMENLAKTLPSGMWLTNLNTVSGDTITQLSFNALAYNNYVISNLLQSLQDSSYFQNSEISGITSTTGDKGVPIKQFSIKVDYLNQYWE